MSVYTTINPDFMSAMKHTEGKTTSGFVETPIEQIMEGFKLRPYRKFEFFELLRQIFG